MVNRLPYETAEELVLETVRQLNDRGYKVSRENLYHAIETANINPKSIKMQFKLSKKPEFDQNIIGPNHRHFWFFPRRILLNTTTNYKPNIITTLVKQIEANYFSKRIKGFDSSYVCRRAREDPQVSEIMHHAYADGKKYSLMGTLGEIYGEDAEGRKAHDEHGDIFIRTPIIIVPGARTEEIAQLESFCKQFQIPAQERIDTILGITD
jgi:hypothetical protein